jgi:ethanolamine utilization protein EutA (predicted chaperonin)
MNDKKSHKLDISLNKDPEWEIDVKVGAAKVKLDFSQYKVSKFNLETGATTTNLTFGDKEKIIKANVQMGAATLKINIPNKTGCMIKGDMVMMIKDLDDFEKIDKRRYKSYNFDNSKNKIYINLDGGVSTLEVKRY